MSTTVSRGITTPVMGSFLISFRLQDAGPKIVADRDLIDIQQRLDAPHPQMPGDPTRHPGIGGCVGDEYLHRRRAYRSAFSSSRTEWIACRPDSSRI